MGLLTRTAVARNPCVSWAFLFTSLCLSFYRLDGEESYGWTPCVGRKYGPIFRRLWTKVHQIKCTLAGEIAVFERRIIAFDDILFCCGDIEKDKPSGLQALPTLFLFLFFFLLLSDLTCSTSTIRCDTINCNKFTEYYSFKCLRLNVLVVCLF